MTEDRGQVARRCASLDAMDPRRRIMDLARDEGFELVRFALAEPLVSAREAAQARLAEGHLDGMSWITADWLERSTTPTRFLPGARTVVLFALPCHHALPRPGETARRRSGDLAPSSPRPLADTTAGGARGSVARYAWGRDYHRVFEKKLRRIARTLRDEFGATARATVDYGPLLERPLAAAAGMGWPGRSTMLLVPGIGPWVLLGAIATDLAIEPDAPLRKSCGTCTRCVVACPTGALSPAGHVLDARLCISYHTIENRGPIPRDLRAKFGDWIFGCDDCLDSCPVGAANYTAYPGLAPHSPEDARPVLAPVLSLDEAAFEARFGGRPIMRAKRDGFLRNVCVALGNVGGAGDLPALLKALDDQAPLVRGHAAWAAARLAARAGLDPAPTVRALRDRLAVEEDPFVRDELELAIGAGGPERAT